MARTVLSAVNDAVTRTKEETPKEHIELLGVISKKIELLRGNGYSGKTYATMSADELSMIQGELSILKSELGDVLAEANRSFQLSERYYKLKKSSVRVSAVKKSAREMEKIGRKTTENTINSMITRMTVDEKFSCILHEEHYNKCLNTWRSLNSLIDSITNRCNVLASTHADVKFFENSLPIV